MPYKSMAKSCFPLGRWPDWRTVLSGLREDSAGCIQTLLTEPRKSLLKIEFEWIRYLKEKGQDRDKKTSKGITKTLGNTRKG